MGRINDDSLYNPVTAQEINDGSTLIGSLGGGVEPTRQFPISVLREIFGGAGNVGRSFLVLSTNETLQVLADNINDLPQFTIGPEAVTWFHVVHPFQQEGVYKVSKYRIVDVGAGTYGLEGTIQVGPENLDFVCTVEMTEDLFPDAIVYEYGDIDEPIEDWVNSQFPALTVQNISAGGTIFQGMMNGVQTDYLFIGEGGLYGVGQQQSTADDFQVLSSGSATPTDQNNIARTLNIKISGELTEANIASFVNLQPEFTIEDIDLYWVYALRTVNGTPEKLAKCRLVNTGKGTYGVGGDIDVVAENISIITITDPTGSELGQFNGTVIILYGDLEGGAIEDWLNVQSPAIDIQDSNLGYTIFQGSLNEDTKAEYLWIGEAGTYGAGQEQSTFEDFQLLNTAESALDSQNNIVKQRLFITPIQNPTSGQVAALINAASQFTVQETEIYIFSVLSTGATALLYKYVFQNIGKGTYGTGGTSVLANQLFQISITAPIADYFTSDPNTEIYNLGEIGITPVEDALNAFEEISIQSQAAGYTIFQTTVDGEEKDYLWIGDAGNYGDGSGNTAVDGDFQLLSSSSVVGGIQSIQAGTNIEIDVSDPLNPIVNATGAGGGGIESIEAGDNIQVDDSDPLNPIISSSAVPLEGTSSGSPIVGPVQMEGGYFYSTSLMNVGAIDPSSTITTSAETSYSISEGFARSEFSAGNGSSNRASVIALFEDGIPIVYISGGINENFKGAEYNQDYSANYSDRSLVDKEWVSRYSRSFTEEIPDTGTEYQNDKLIGATEINFIILAGGSIDQGPFSFDDVTGTISGISVTSGDRITINFNK